jgi:hypothetical protein
MAKKKSAHVQLLPNDEMRSSEPVKKARSVKKSASRHVLPGEVLRSSDVLEKPVKRKSATDPKLPSSVLRSLDPDQIIGELILQCRIRRQVLSARTRLSNQLDAQERLITGKAKGGKESKNTFVVSPEARAAAEHVSPVLAVHMKSLSDAQKPYDKAIEGLAKQLPVYTWAKDVRGCGPLLLGLIIGETGDLTNYANPAKVWKRMGLAVMPDGKRQRRVTGEEAIEHGYNAQRRSLMYLLGDCFIKVGGDGPYRALYDQRKELELERLPAEAKGRKGWAHARASRYVQKRFLVHLWEAWRQRIDDTHTFIAPASPSLTSEMHA